MLFTNEIWPQASTANIQIFNAVQNTTTTTSWQTWQKPKGCSWVYILLIASGGGGGKGAGNAATVAPGGGGAGGFSRLWVPSFLIPDTLYIRVGNGGLGATTSGSGTAGTASYIGLSPLTTPASVLLLTQAGGGGGGGAATSTAGAAGAIGTAAANASSGLGLWTSIAGQAGTSGSAAANGVVTSVTPGTSGIITSSGAGGGNGTAAGGAINASTPWPTIAAGVGTTGGAGSHGFNRGKIVDFVNSGSPFIFSGGTGGGGHTNGAAGAGGNGGIGGGGGGGGNSSQAGGTAGNGGNGGDGLVIIMAG